MKQYTTNQLVSMSVNQSDIRHPSSQWFSQISDIHSQ